MQTLRDQFFDSPFEKRMFRGYRKFFSIQELESNVVLRWVFGATLLSHLVTFSSWIGSLATTADAYDNNTFMCWPYFQNCGDFLFLHALPQGYSQSTLYMVLYGLMFLSVYCIYRSDWVLAHLLLVPSFLWHTWVTYFLAQTLVGNYEYYVFSLSFVLLFLPHKEYFLKLSIVLFYFLSTSAKIHDTWIVGSYFSSLKTGLPLVPDTLIPIATNFVMFMEMVGAWFLMSGRPLLQRTVLAFFIFFHLYSGIIVGFHYPTIVLPTLLILFGPLYRYASPPFDTRSVAGWFLVLLMLAAQSLPKLIPGDEKLTLEGNMYGLYMFDANHQCVSTGLVTFSDGTTRALNNQSISARDRCDPYRIWFHFKQLCERGEGIARIAWTFDHSINGGPFLRVVDVFDACVLNYYPFSHNEWIKTEYDMPPVIGQPVKNIYI